MFLLTAAAPSVRAAEAANDTVPKKAGWYKTQNGYAYLQTNGKYVKASKAKKYKIVEIKGKSYAFNSSGIQVHGWRKINGKYYWFAYGTKGKGAMAKNTVVNNVRLTKTGAASAKTERAKKKVELMAKYSEWADQILKNKPYASKTQRLKTCFDYLRRLPYRYVSYFRGNKNNTKKNKIYDPDYDIWGAEYVLNYHRFDCHPIAAAFAYMANAVGYSDCVMYTIEWANGGTHSFSSAEGLYYDTSLARHKLGSYYYFAMKNYGMTKRVKWTIGVDS